jgi:hypothetical protein
MFGQLLPNKNKIVIVWRDVYYAKFAFKVWYLNQALDTETYVLMSLSSKYCEEKIRG